MVGEHFPDEKWDELLLQFPDHSIFQSSLWAKHKERDGWTCRRVVGYTKEGRPYAGAQVLIKSVPGGAVLWGRGAPLGEIAAWNDELRRALVHGLGAPVRYLRVCSYREASKELVAGLVAAGWKRPERPFNANTNFKLDLSQDEPALEAALSSNWSHNLRRGLKRCKTRVWESPDPEEMAQVYRAMQAYKGVPSPYDAQTLRSLVERLGPALRLWRADDESGKPIALRAAAVFGDAGWDLLAAASDAGRKVYASYALMWNVLLDCKAKGARRYDLGGADEKSAKGVYDFKKGTGARFVQCLGEWDWATPALARGAVGWAVAKKVGAG